LNQFKNLFSFISTQPKSFWPNFLLFSPVRKGLGPVSNFSFSFLFFSFLRHDSPVSPDFARPTGQLAQLYPSSEVVFLSTPSHRHCPGPSRHRAMHRPTKLHRPATVCCYGEDPLGTLFYYTLLRREPDLHSGLALCAGEHTALPGPRVYRGPVEVEVHGL
jgi:hypothetical protein